MGDPLLRLRRVRKEFSSEPRTVALDDVDLDIGEGEFVAIEGPSGGGKSTLLNVIGLLDHPTAGEYEIRGVSTTNLTSKALSELRSSSFSFIFQSFHLLDRRPAIDSVELNLLYRGVPVRRRRRLALAALKELGMGELAWRRSSLLSGGERQRVAIARAIASRTPVVVADEPTGNLDSANSDKVMEAIESLVDQGATVVLVTHDPTVAARAVRRVRIIDGKLDGPPQRSITRQVGSTPEGKPSTLRITDLIADAVLSVFSRIGRTVGLAAAVAIAVGLAVGTLGVVTSASAQVAETFDAHASRDVSLSWTEQSLATDLTARENLVDRVQSLTGVDAVAVLDETGNREVAGVPGRDHLFVTSYSFVGNLLEAGRLSVAWIPGCKSVGPGEALLGRNLADQLGVGPLAAGPVVLLDGHPTVIVGIIDDSPRLPQLMGAVALLGEGPSQIDRTSVLILAKPGAANQTAHQAPLAVDPINPEKISVSAPIDPSSVRAEIEADVVNTLAAFTVLALVAAIAGLTNSMVLSVLERRQEFGLRRAVGARGFHVASLVLTESVVIGFIGGVGGLLLGFGAVLTMTLLRQWTPVFDVTLAPLAVIGGVLIGGLGGLGASLRALRIHPAEALRM